MANRILKSQTSLDEKIIGNTEFHKIQVSIPDSKSRSYEYVVKKRYRNLEYISEGAQGSVVSGTDTLTGGRVAIKRIELTQSYSKFNYREIEILTRVEHDIYHQSHRYFHTCPNAVRNDILLHRNGN